MIRLHYFASLAEHLGKRTEELEPVANVHQLIETLKQRGEPWNQVLSTSKVLVAVNQQMSSYDQALNDNDEVALFPPVTGG